jgi:hypothetical protein
MSERARAQRAHSTPTGEEQRYTPRETRFGGRFWDAVEHEVEAVDHADFALFMAAHRLPIEPRPGFRAGLEARLYRVFAARWSN